MYLYSIYPFQYLSIYHIVHNYTQNDDGLNHIRLGEELTILSMFSQGRIQLQHFEKGEEIGGGGIRITVE